MLNDQPFKILMLEDDMDDRYITEAFFTEKGYNIQLEFLEFSDTTIRHLEDQHSSGSLPNLIILDLNMPRRSGMEVLKEIKSHQSLRFIPVVIVSGTAFPREVKECYSLGANSFIQKPVSDQLTNSKIESFIQYWFNIVELPALQPMGSIA